MEQPPVGSKWQHGDRTYEVIGPYPDYANFVLIKLVAGPEDMPPRDTDRPFPCALAPFYDLARPLSTAPVVF